MSAASKASPKSTVSFRAGQPVMLADREPVTGPDAKPLPFYEYYRNLSGTVAKVFDDGTVSVTIDRASLPQEIRRRHEECEQRDRDKWLDKLSDEERNRLTAQQKQFSYRYTVLVAASDLLASDANSKPAPAPREKAAPTAKAPPAADTPPTPRPSLEDLTAAEERHLREIEQRAKGS